MTSRIESASELVLGIDGGGTKTVAWLGTVEDPGIILGRGAAGPGNVRAVGFATAQMNIAAAIDAAFRDARLPQSAVAAACLSLAGAGRPEEQGQMTAWATGQRIADIIRITSDAEPVLAAGSPEAWGVALICGTGSLAWGRTVSGQTARAGGWGYLLGDEGSAYWIARTGLQAVVRAADGRDQPTALLEAFLDRLDLTEPMQLIDCIYAQEMTRDRLAGLGDVVFSAAKDDRIAAEIVESGAKELAQSIAAVASRLSFAPHAYPLALAGGIVLNQDGYRERIVFYLRSAGLSPGNVTLVSEPVLGALKLSRTSIR